MLLFLFDIDGTILLSQGTGRIAVQEALSRVCNRKITSDGIAFSGRTDPDIMRDMLVQGGVPEHEVDAIMETCLDAYVKALMHRLTPGLVNVLPGASRLIRLLHDRRDIVLGLLTGNLQETAYLKLQAAGLSSYFPFGAFGSDHDDRELLPAIAVRRATMQGYPEFAGTSVVVIGDTHKDIGCGKAYGAWTIGVATGWESREQLADCEPDLLLDDLSNPDPVLDFIDGIARAC